MLGTVCDAEDRPAVAVGARTPGPAIALRRGCCAARRTRTCRGGSRPRRPPRPAARTGRGTARAVGLTPTLRVAASSTSASTATGDAVDDDERVQVDAHDVGIGLGSRARGRAGPRRAPPGRRPARPGTRRAAPGSRRSSIISSASTRGRCGTSRNCHVGDRLGEHAADPEHHARAELRVGVQPGDQLPRAPAPSASTSSSTAPSSGRAGASSSAAARARPRRRRRGRAARGPARSCGRSRRRTSFTTTG